MDLKIIKKSAKEIELEIIGENETILNPITEVLLKNNDVEYASYMSDHPDSKKRKLFIRIKQGKPEDALKKAVKQLEDEIKTFIKKIDVKSKK